MLLTTRISATDVGSGHTESGLPRRAANCARGGKAFELYYVRLHHPRQTERLHHTRQTKKDCMIPVKQKAGWRPPRQPVFCLTGMMQYYVMQFEGLPAAGTDRCSPRQPAFCVARHVFFITLVSTLTNSYLCEVSNCRQSSTVHSYVPEDQVQDLRLGQLGMGYTFKPLNPELNPICYLLALLGAPHFLHVSRRRVKLLTFRLLMSYIYGAPIIDVSRSHTTTQHSR